MAKTNKFPKTVYVYWENYSADEPYLMTCTSAEDALKSSGEDELLVGVYELKETATAESRTTITVTPAPKAR